MKKNVSEFDPKAVFENTKTILSSRSIATHHGFVYKRNSVLNSLDEQTRNLIIKSSLISGDNIIITGGPGSGKSSLYRDLLALISDIPFEYTAIDEVCTKEDIAYVNSRLSGRDYQKLLFTNHINNATKIKETFPEFEGIWIYLERSEDNKFKANVQSVV